MPEIEEIKREEREDKKVETKAGNPLQRFLSRKVKIAGREFPMPLLVLGAFVIGIIIFVVMGKKRGNGISTETAQDEQSAGLGLSEGFTSIADRAESSQNESIGEFQSDFGQNVLPSPPIPEFQPLPSIAPAIPLPQPSLPYADFGSNFFTPSESFQPPQQPQEFYPIRNVDPSIRSRSEIQPYQGGSKGKLPKTLPIRPRVQQPIVIRGGDAKGKMPKLQPQRAIIPVPQRRPPPMPVPMQFRSKGKTPKSVPQTRIRSIFSSRR